MVDRLRHRRRQSQNTTGTNTSTKSDLQSNGEVDDADVCTHTHHRSSLDTISSGQSSAATSADDATSTTPTSATPPTPATTTTSTTTTPPPSLLHRATLFLDSFHGRQLTDANTNELDIWRIRCLLTVSWTTALSGVLLVPLYILAGVYTLAATLATGCAMLLAVPWAYQRRYGTHRQCSWVVAVVAVWVMTVLTAGSGGFPVGLAPGIQRILPIMVLCFGSLELGALVTGYVMVEVLVFWGIGPFPAVLSMGGGGDDDGNDDDTVHTSRVNEREMIMDWICLGSWMLQPVILFCLGVSLHMAGTQTVQKLMSVSEAKARFLSIVSHELRTPLHGILGSCELGLAGSSSDGDVANATDEKVDALRSCQLAAQHLRLIVEDLLLYSSSAAIRIRSEPFEVSNLYKSLKATLQQSETNCKLIFVDPPEPMWFLGDELRLRQCFINVIGNGIKFCSENDTITIQLVSAQAGETDGDPWTLEFCIQDTGPGIRQEDIKRIFAPFEQAVGTTQKSLAGVGLGLSIVVTLLQKMNGKIRCESVLGEGSSFYFTIRVPRTEDPDKKSTNWDNDAPSSTNTSQLTQATDGNLSTAETAGTLQLVPDEQDGGDKQKTLLQEKILSTNDCNSQVKQRQPVIAVPQSPLTTPPTAPESRKVVPQAEGFTPIVIATKNDCNLTCLLDWEGEENIFEVRDGYRSWNEVVECIVASHEHDVDLIVLDDSDEALRCINDRRKASECPTIESIPVIRVTTSYTCTNSKDDLFDATIHMQLLPGLLRSWYRALALGAWILVVDDFALNRKLLHKQLARLGHRVSEACNGQEALDKATAAGFSHDMIAMDIMVRCLVETFDPSYTFVHTVLTFENCECYYFCRQMPVMGGLMAAEKIRQLEAIVKNNYTTTRPCPIFAVTAGDKTMTSDWSNFDGFLEKPINIQKLRRIVRHQVIRRLLPP